MFLFCKSGDGAARIAVHPITYQKETVGLPLHGTLWPTAKPSRSRKTLARLARHRGDGRTVRVVASNARDEGVAVARCWSRFRYLSKEFDPNVGFGRVDEKDRPLREILKVTLSDGAAGGLRANGGRQPGHLDEGAA